MANISGDTDLIISLRAEQTQLRRDLAKAKGQMRNFAKQSQTIAARIQTSMAVAFGGFALIEGIRSTVMTMAEFEYQMDKVQAVSGASSEEIKKLVENAKELGAKSKFSALQIGQLQESLARLGFTTDQILAMTDSARKLATVADTELSPAADVLGKMINAFNLEAKDADRVANTMAESFTKTALDLEKFSVGMSYAATAGRLAGFSIEEVSSMLGILASNGIPASKAGTALRDIFADMSNKGMTLTEALDKIRNATDKNKTSYDLFGKTSMNAAAILSELEEKYKELARTFGDGNRELDRTVAIMEDNLLTDLDLLKSAFVGLTLEGGLVTEMARDLAQSFTGMFEGMTDISRLDVSWETWFNLVGMKKVAANAKDFANDIKLIMQWLDPSENPALGGGGKGGLWMNLPFPKGEDPLKLAMGSGSGGSTPSEMTEEELAKIQAALKSSSRALSESLGDWSLWDNYKFTDEQLQEIKDMSMHMSRLWSELPTNLQIQRQTISEEFENLAGIVEKSLTEMETKALEFGATLFQSFTHGASAIDLVRQTLAATQQEVLSMLMERIKMNMIAAKSNVVAQESKWGVAGLAAAAVGIAIISRMFSKMGAKGSSAAPTSINPIRRDVSDYNNITGSLRIVTGAGGLSGIIEAEGNRNGLRGG